MYYYIKSESSNNNNDNNFDDIIQTECVYVFISFDVSIGDIII